MRAPTILGMIAAATLFYGCSTAKHLGKDSRDHGDTQIPIYMKVLEASGDSIYLRVMNYEKAEVLYRFIDLERLTDDGQWTPCEGIHFDPPRATLIADYSLHSRRRGKIVVPLYIYPTGREEYPFGSEQYRLKFVVRDAGYDHASHAAAWEKSKTGYTYFSR